MNIHEHQAKDIFRKYGIPVQNGVAIFQKDDIESVIKNFDANLYVIKSQIHAGGRGKAGGVKLSKNKNEAIEIAKKMWGMKLVTPQTGEEGKIVQRLYIESGSDISSEFYISAVIDRNNKCISFIASSEGGTDIEEVAEHNSEKIIQVDINPSIGLRSFHILKMSNSLNIPKTLYNDFAKIIKGVYRIFIELDANQIEINPLIITTNNDILALDAKVSFDDNALFKHQRIKDMKDDTESDPLEVEAEKFDLNYIKMDGNIGCMVNGAGLAMATMDIIKLYGASPANFLDVGGSATTEKVTKAFSIILSDQKVKAILVNIFGGIMRCDIIANGIVQAAEKVDLKIPLIVRLAGTNVDIGTEILNRSNLKIITAKNLGDAAKKAVESIK